MWFSMEQRPCYTSSSANWPRNFAMVAVWFVACPANLALSSSVYITLRLQTLLYRGQRMMDDQLCGSFGITPDAVIHCVLGAAVGAAAAAAQHQPAVADY